MNSIKIGIVEDEFIIAEMLIHTLNKLGYATTEPASTFDEAISMIEEEKPDLILLDIQIEGAKDGIDVGHYINKQTQIPFIYLTANADPATVQRAKSTSPPAYLTKPFTPHDLYTAIEICMDNFEKENASRGVTPKRDILEDAIFIKEGNYFHKIKIEI